MRPPKKYRREARKWRLSLERHSGPHRFNGMIGGYPRFSPKMTILYPLRNF